MTYPHDPEILSLCDELGIYLWQENLGSGNSASELTDKAFIADLMEVSLLGFKLWLPWLQDIHSLLTNSSFGCPENLAQYPYCPICGVSEKGMSSGGDQEHIPLAGLRGRALGECFPK